MSDTAGYYAHICCTDRHVTRRGGEHISGRGRRGHLLMVSATAGTSARRTMFSRPRYLMLGSRTLMNFPSSDTPAREALSVHSTCETALGVNMSLPPCCAHKLTRPLAPVSGHLCAVKHPLEGDLLGVFLPFSLQHRRGLILTDHHRQALGAWLCMSICAWHNVSISLAWHCAKEVLFQVSSIRGCCWLHAHADAALQAHQH